MSGPTPSPGHSAAIGVDHVGIVAAGLHTIAAAFTDLGFTLTPIATHGDGRIANRCVMLRDGGYLELMATAPGMTSTTLERFLARGPGAHILALQITDEAAVLDRLRRAGVAADLSITERDADRNGDKARFALIMPPDPPEGRILLVRQLTRDLLWRPDTLVHPNRAVGLTEVVYATGTPAETMSNLSRLTGRPAEPDPLGGYRIQLQKARLRVLPRIAGTALFPGATPPLVGLTIEVEDPGITGQVVVAGGVAIRFTDAPV